jgi:phage minor structural protein GP20
MKRKFLEDLGLSKEVIDKIMDENGKDIEAAKGELDAEKSKVSELTKEVDGYKGQIKERDKQLEEIKKSSGDNEELKKQIESLEEANKQAKKEHEAEITQLKIDSAVTAALTTANAKNITAVKALLNLKDAKLADDGSVIGLKEQIESLTKADDTKFLFETVTFKGVKTGESGDIDDEPADFSKMTLDEVEAYMESHPDTEI